MNRSLDQPFSHVSDGRGVALGGKLYRILLGPKLSYAQVSSFDSHSTKNEAAAVNGSCDNTANSLEGWSNDIHAILGAGPSKTYRGHIGMPEYAAFDPIFWLHRWYGIS